MAIFKCKMCGGSLEVTEGMTVCECEYCGTQQTLPKTDNEQNLNMANRANHFRQQCEFDKAMEIYERLLNNSDGDAEIYWSIVLCRYGIEYVDDPLTKKKIPTCHRTQYKSILEDTDYLEAISHADTQQKMLYQNEAQYIDSVQKGILEISNKEEPFDVFICYKESDESGRRTQDSVLAQELYYHLVREGFKVFFSRITLEGKLGTAYEPYIFAALNSAKVMVVVGTEPEYFNAVWVKNEWSRFLMLMQNDRSKTLIPAYKDMDPYDLPDALSMFQAQDMSKLGFMQDLIRGINKLAKDEPKQTVVKETVVTTGNANTVPLLKRAFLFLEDGDWDNADAYCEKVLDLDPECAQAYLGKLLAKLHLNKAENLPNVRRDFSNSDNYKKAIRFGDSAFKKKIEDYNKQATYNGAIGQMKTAKSDVDFCAAKVAFEQIINFSDAKNKAEECEVKALECTYNRAVALMEQGNNAETFRQAKVIFAEIEDYADSKEKAQECEEKTIECIELDRKNLYAYIKAKDWKRAEVFCESLIKEIPDCAIAYFFKIIIAYNCGKKTTAYERYARKLEKIAPDVTIEEKEYITYENHNEYFWAFVRSALTSRVKYVISKYPKIQCYNSSYTSLISYAMFNENEYVVRTLLECGADVNSYRIIKNKNNGFETKIYSLYDSIIEFPNTKLTKILLDHAADANYMQEINETEYPETLSILSKAICDNNVHLVKTLLENGANPNSYRIYNNKYGSIKLCALGDAIWNVQNVKIVELLLEHGADPNLVEKFVDDNGYKAERSMLSYAISTAKSKEIVALLLKYGANWENTIKYSGKKKVEMKFPFDKCDYLSRDFINFLRSNGWKGSIF